MNEINYKELLKKYMSHVIGCEGIDFLDSLNCPWGNEEITKEEAKELKKISKGFTWGEIK